MSLTETEKGIMVSILRTMIYNNFSDLKLNYIENKDKLSLYARNILLFGDSDLIQGKNTYRTISKLEYRWCLKSILYYHLQKTGKITKSEYNSFFCI